MTNTPKPILTPAEVAHWLGVPPRQVLTWAASGQLSAITGPTGRVTHIRASSVDALLKAAR